MGTADWIDLKKDAETGIETIRAHFEGHAYDPHFHDSYLIGFTEQGVQQFHCRRTLHSSTPEQVFLLEPGELHDGHAPTPGGFTYSMLYLDPHWIERELRALFEDAPSQCQPAFAKTLESEPALVTVIADAFQALQSQDLRIVRQAALDALLGKLARHLAWRPRLAADPRLPTVALRARDYLHAHMDQIWGWTIWRGPPVSIASGCRGRSRRLSAWRRMPIWSSCAWPRPVACSQPASHRRWWR